MSRAIVQPFGIIPQIRRVALRKDIQNELLRKGIHMSVALVPFLAALLGTVPTLGLLAFGTLTYAYAESLRGRGGAVPLISWVTERAARDRDMGRFVLGPVTLGIGAMLALMLYPAPAAAIGIFALAFGDGIASVAGKVFGRTRIPFIPDKSLEGSLACFLAVVLATAAVTSQLHIILAAALVATVLEAMPVRDADNLLLPVGVGLTVTALL